MHKGSCLCGTIEYEVNGPLGPVIYCHCSRCRKANGTTFATNSPIATANFRVTKGEESLRAFSTPSGVHRVFCSNCGSPIISKRDAMPDVVRLRLGTLDTPLDAGPTAHIFAASKADWFDIRDGLPQFPEKQ